MKQKLGEVIPYLPEKIFNYGEIAIIGIMTLAFLFAILVLGFKI